MLVKDSSMKSEGWICNSLNFRD